jgi:uncharacterized protein involved in exopolysaccharide biosynthesis
MNNQKKNQNKSVSLSSIPKIIWQYKIFIFLFTSIFTASIVFYIVNKPNEYTVGGIYIPKGSEEGGALSKLAGQFGGLASMAGINIGGSSGDRTEVAIELLKSRAFLQSFIEKHDLIVPLMAVKKWDKETNTLIIDESKYDVKNKKWIREVPKGKNQVPSSWEAYTKLNDKISIDYMSKKGIVKINLTYFSPEIASKWLVLLVQDINLFWKQRDLYEASKYIDLLTQKTTETNVAELRSVFYELIAEQTKTKLLSEITDEVMFETVSAIVIPEDKSSPKRALICVIALIFSSLLSTVISIFFAIWKSNRVKM